MDYFTRVAGARDSVKSRSVHLQSPAASGDPHGHQAQTPTTEAPPPRVVAHLTPLASHNVGRPGRAGARGGLCAQASNKAYEALIGRAWRCKEEQVQAWRRTCMEATVASPGRRRRRVALEHLGSIFHEDRVAQALAGLGMRSRRSGGADGAGGRLERALGQLAAPTKAKAAAGAKRARPAEQELTDRSYPAHLIRLPI